MKKKLLFVLICLISVFTIVGEARAEQGAYGTTGPGTDATTSGGSEVVVTTAITGQSGLYLQAVRFSVYKVTKNGSNYSVEKKGDSIDVVQNKTMYNNLKKLNVRRVSTLRSKVDYIKDQISISTSRFAKATKISDNLYYSGQLLPGYKFPVIFGSGAATGNNAFRPTLDTYFKNNKGHFKNLLLKMGVSESEFCDDGIYLVAEPITAIGTECKGNPLVCGTRWMGTAYELSIFKNYRNGTILSNALGNQLPFALYLGKNSGDTDTLGFVGTYLSTVSYISKNLTPAAIRTLNGYGLNVFWVRDNNYCDIPEPEPEPEPQPEPEPEREYCNYYNPEHFASISSGPNGENCCEYFKNSGNYPNLVEDYPICGNCSDSGATYSVNGSCSSTNTGGNFIGSIIDFWGNIINGISGSNTSTNPNVNQNGSVVNIKDKYTIDDNTCLPLMEEGSDSNKSSSLTEFKINDYCSIKCVEENTIIIPKAPRVVLKTNHFVWPSSPSTANLFGNEYIMSSTGILNCRIVVNSIALSRISTQDRERYLNQCALQISSNISDDMTKLYDYSPTIDLTYTPTGQSMTTKTTLEIYDENVTCKKNDLYEDCKLSDFKTDVNVDSIRALRFSIVKSMKYKLPSTLNTYVSKTDTISNDTSSDDKNYTIIGYGNIPISFLSNSSSLQINYQASGTLQVSISNLGHNGHFGSNQFTCDANFSAIYDDSGSNNSTKYYCRVGTDKAGKDISGCVDSLGILNEDCVVANCLDTKEYYCSLSSPSPGKSISSNLFESKIREFKDNDTTNSYTQDDYILMTQNYFDNSSECSSGNNGYVCSSGTDYPGMDITSCVKGLGFNDINEVIEACANVKCKNENIYKCPPGTDYAGWDIGICVVNSKANDLASAQKLCEDAICNRGKNGQVVIYRPIDLDNPFPSITGLTLNDDSTQVLGRLPGANWRTSNSSNIIDKQVIVKEYITNNRNVITEDVYSKTPLYTFELKTSTIKNIRDYNKNKTFDDFNLRCNAGRECISEGFVHNPDYGFVDDSTKSTCTTKEYDQFYKCLN